MAPTIVTLSISSASDGTGADPGPDYRRNDVHYLERIAERWIKDQSRSQPGVAYRLERLPPGYAGYERTRADGHHIDRYLYGHPRGHFRSMVELYPHFKHLQDHGTAAGCICKLCSRNNSGDMSVSSSTPSTERPKTKASWPNPPSFALNKPITSRSAIPKPQPGSEELPQGRRPSDPPSRSKQVDEEGTPDVYRVLIDRLQEAGPESVVDEDIANQLSPDWRVGHKMLYSLLTEWEQLPKYVPRVGEVVLFTRAVTDESVTWEAGVVTQMPIEPLSAEDLLGVPEDKKHNVTYSGFRIEPLSQPGNKFKPFSTQHRYVSLHAIRPFSLWKEYAQPEYHPTVIHALTVANSACILGRYRFKGIWPEATVFASGIYLGAELLMIGDTVKLAPLEGKTSITDVMRISSIRLEFVDLHKATNDDYDKGRPYSTCVHVAGRAYTLDPKRSFAGIGRSPISPKQLEDILPGLGVYGQWFHMIDPQSGKGRLEVPFHRLLGRCYEGQAVKSWFAPRHGGPVSDKICNISQDLTGFREARGYSVEHDSRVYKAGGKQWFWAETRIEQLDLHEVNGEFVGIKEEERSSQQVHAWRHALKVLDGKKEALESYYELEAKKKREQEQQPRTAAKASSSARGPADGDKIEDAMEIDGEEEEFILAPETAEHPIINLVRDTDNDDDESMED